MQEAKQAAELTFLALAVWREARGESRAAKAAVAHSILNRVKHPGWWGKSNVHMIVFKRWQYSSMTDPKDKQLTTWPAYDDPSWGECLEIAGGVMAGTMPNPAPGADSYFDDSLQGTFRPRWAGVDIFVAKIGRLNFYDTDHSKDKA